MFSPFASMSHYLERKEGQEIKSDRKEDEMIKQPKKIRIPLHITIPFKLGSIQTFLSSSEQIFL